jgi:hypothetical protein
VRSSVRQGFQPLGGARSGLAGQGCYRKHLQAEARRRYLVG